ncbi:Protein ANTAGONIST OF LIKE HETEROCHROMATIN PROTEIN 1 [Bienertia sinuspersici]
MSSSTFEWLSGLLDPLLECRDPVNSPLNLSAELRLGIGLYRLSSGSDYSEIATRFRVSNRVAEFCSTQLCRVLCTNFRFWVGFPNSGELNSVSKKFETLTGLPNCCGVIDCTRFKVKRTSNSKEESVSAQLVVDSTSRILSIIAGFQGDKSKTRVLKSSSLFKDVRERKLMNSSLVYLGEIGIPQYLVGKGKNFDGYPLLPWLMIPFDDPKPGSNEEKFNIAHGLTRTSMAKTVASLKNWGILSKPIEEEFRNAVAYVGACAILHNALLLREDYSGLCDHVTEDVDDHDHSHELMQKDDSNLKEISIDGCLIRNALATKVSWKK